MQQISSNYKNEIKQPSRHFECRVTIGKNIYTNESIVDIILDYPQAIDGFSIGNTTSQSLDLTLLNTGEEIYSTNQIKVEIGLQVGSDFEYILMGYYNVDEVSKNDYTIKFTAFDNMMKFETPYFSSLGDKPILQQVVNELATITGISFVGSIPSYTVTKLEGYTCREVLSYVASLCGGNALITRDGKFTVRTPQNVECVITTENHFGLTTEEVPYKLGKITCLVNSEVELSKGATGTDSMELSFENPWMTESILNTLYQQLNGFSYLGFQAKWQGDLSLDPYDLISIQDKKGTSYKVPILNQKFIYVGGLTSEIAAKGESKNKNSFSSSGPTANKTNRLVTEQAIIKEALINKASIQDLEAVSIRTQTLEATTAKIQDAIIDVAHISDLNAVNAKIESLQATDVTIQNAIINKADISELNAAVANINILNADLGVIKHLVNGNLSSENIQAGGITSDKLTIANGFIKDAMIDSLNANKITAGQINTALVRVSSASGNLVINDNTIQIRDANRVRVQIGKDASNDYSMSVWDSNGKLMFDARGLKADAIKDSIIRDDMISANANIDGSKLNISSVVSSINHGSSTLKASKVQFDGIAQTLEVAFNALKTQADATKTQTESNTTAISVAQGQIKTLIQDTTITKDGVTTTLKDEYSRLEQTVSGLNSTIGKQQTIIDDHSGKITSTNSELSTLKQSVNGLSASISSAQTTINSHTTLINQKADLTAVNDKINSAKNELNTSINKKANAVDVYNKTDVYTRTETDSKIQIAKDAINLGVSQTYETKTNVASKIDGIQIGARNLLLKTDGRGEPHLVSASRVLSGVSTSVSQSSGTFKITSASTTLENYYRFMSPVHNNLWGLEVDNTYVISGYIRGNAKSVKYRWQTSNGTSWGLNGAEVPIDTPNATDFKHFTFTLTIPNQAKGVYFSFQLYNPQLGEWVEFKKIKFEKGNKATDWTPAPEDIGMDIHTSKQEAIDAANGTLTTTISNYYTKSQTNSQIDILKDEINLGVSQKYETIENVTTQVSSTLNSAKSYADTKKTEAISTASTDATNKVNSAKNELNTAIGKKANSVDVYTKTEVYTKSQTDSQINVAKDAINLGVSQTYETKTNVASQVTSTLNSAKSYADTKKSEAISSASSDATTKSNSALNNAKSYADTKKQEAITSANNTLNSTIANYYTKTQTDSQINVAKNAITQSVANTYETKTEVTNKINAIQIGGVNLLLGTKNFSSGKGGGVIQSDTYNGLSILYKDNSTGSSYSDVCAWNSSINVKPNTEYTLSFYAKGSGSFTSYFYANVVASGYSSEGAKTTASDGAIYHTLTGSWKRYWIVWKTLSNALGMKNVLPMRLMANGGKGYICGVKFEEGNKATDWSPAPEDMETTVSSLTQRVTSAESKITDTAITNVVKQNFYTKTETNNQITSKGYQTASQVQQTVDNLQIKFTQSGGYNLIRNSSGLNGTQCWTGTATLGTATNANIGGACDKYMYLDNGTTTSERFAYSSRFKLKPSTTYTLTGWFHNFTKCPSFDVFVLSSTSVDSSDTGTSYTNVHQLINAENTNGTWKKYTISFTTPAGCKSGVIRIDNNGYNSSGTNSNRIHWSALILSEGSLEVPWSPHPNEVYDGITQIDKDGIKVSTSKGAYTHFSADGMNSYDNSNRQTLGIRNGGMTFYAYNNNEYVGYISQSVKATGSANGVSIGISPQGEYLSLGLSSVSDPNSGFAQTSKFVVARTTNTSESMTEGLNAYAHLDMHGWNLNNVNGVNVNGGINIKNNGMIKFDSASTYASAIWEDTSSGNLAVFGDNGVVLGYQNGATNTNILKISETNDSKGCKINSYQHWNFNDWTMYNMQATYNGFTRSSADYVKMFKSSSSSESNFCVELANDYVTYFNIQANNYVDGGKYIARFHYHNGTAANIVGVHFYRAINMHGFNISNVGNMNVFALATEEVVANDIKIVSPYAVASRNGEVESLSVVKSTDDVTEHNDSVTIINGRAEVYLPIGLAHMGYLVHVTPNKLVKVAVTEKLDDYFVIEVDSDEDVVVDYCIKAFQPNYATRVATYGELQGEESPQAITAEEAGKSDEVQYFDNIATLNYVGGDSLTVE